jgi:DNA polymerase III alpha subunit (gram-positive type)
LRELPVSDRPLSTLGFGGKPLAYLDLEFTGLNSRVHDITEIAVLIPSWAPRATLGTEVLPGWSAWCVKVWPENLETAVPVALEINGFCEDIWKQEAISLTHAMQVLGALIVDTTMVGHNLALDIDFVREGFRRTGIVGPDLKYKIDTATLIWEHLVPLGLTKGNLHDACEALQISNEGEHTALADVIRCKALVDALLFGDGPGTLEGAADRIALIESKR